MHEQHHASSLTGNSLTNLRRERYFEGGCGGYTLKLQVIMALCCCSQSSSAGGHIKRDVQAAAPAILQHAMLHRSCCRCLRPSSLA